MVCIGNCILYYPSKPPVLSIRYEHQSLSADLFELPNWGDVRDLQQLERYKTDCPNIPSIAWKCEDGVSEKFLTILPENGINVFEH